MVIQGFAFRPAQTFLCGAASLSCGLLLVIQECCSSDEQSLMELISARAHCWSRVYACPQTTQSTLIVAKGHQALCWCFQ